LTEDASLLSFETQTKKPVPEKKKRTDNSTAYRQLVLFEGTSVEVRQGWTIFPSGVRSNQVFYYTKTGL
jgi:hypothetical protein